MAEVPSIINVGELSKPATVLIEKISEAVGGIFRPYQIKRIAQANSDAAVIAAETDIKLTALHERAFHRFVNEEAKKQENIESITTKAIPQLKEEANPQDVDDDWITNFFDKCRIVSDNEMQSLWAKVLAGEANTPGAFSKRTVNLLSALDKHDAILFQKLCSFGCMIGGVLPLIFDFQDKIYTDNGITFTAIAHLDNVGLLRFESLAGFSKQGMPKRVGVFYYGTMIGLQFEKESDNTLNVGKVILSQMGSQLAPICGSRANSAFFEYLINHWAEEGLLPFSPYPRQLGQARPTHSS